MLCSYLNTTKFFQKFFVVLFNTNFFVLLIKHIFTSQKKNVGNCLFKSIFICESLSKIRLFKSNIDIKL